MDIKTYDKMLSTLAVSSAKLSEQINELVPASVALFYGESNQNIEVINKMLRTVRNLTGFNDSKLVAFYREVIPFAYNTKLREFTNKKPDSSIDESTAQTFMKQFTWVDDKFNTTKAAPVFKPETYIKTVAKKVHNNMSAKDLDVMIQTLIAVKKEVVAKEKAAKTTTTQTVLK